MLLVQTDVAACSNFVTYTPFNHYNNTQKAALFSGLVGWPPKGFNFVASEPVVK